VSAHHGQPEPQQRWYSWENLEIRKEWRHKDSVLHKPPEEKVTQGLNLGTGVATALMRHLLFLCILSTFVASFDWDSLARLCSEPESRLVEKCNHYCLHSTVASAIFLCFPVFYLQYFNPHTQDAQSLTRPGRKQARKHVRDTCNFSNIETRAVIKFFFFPARQGAEGHSRHSDKH